jgi:hypothetical protein
MGFLRFPENRAVVFLISINQPAIPMDTQLSCEEGMEYLENIK